MDIFKSYENIKCVLNGEEMESKLLENSMEHLVSIMEDWLDRYEYSRDFEALMSIVENDYLYSGTLYRGITLLKDSRNIEDKIEYIGAQSFSKKKSIAIDFANNNKVTTKYEINEIKEDSEVIPVIIEITIDKVGVDLHKFSEDLIKVCKSSISNKELSSDFEELLGYAIDEEEVLLNPYTLRNNKDSISIYDIG